MFNIGYCVICKKSCVGYLCVDHIKKYFYNRDLGIVHLKSKRRVSKFQKSLFICIRNFLKVSTYQEAVFPWALGDNWYLRYDIVVPKLKLIVEGDGRQHYKFIKFFAKTVENFKRQQEVDKYKDELAIKNGYKIIRFGYFEDITEEHIRRKLISNGVING